MTHSRLKNIYNKRRSYGNWDKHKNQINSCMKLLRKTTQDYFNNIKSVNDTKKFWKTIKPYLSNKGLNSSKIFLSEKGRPLKDPVTVATTMNDYFLNITQTIGLRQFQFDHANTLFEDRTSIIRIKSNLGNVSGKFDFKKVHEKEVKLGIMNLNSEIATSHGAIPGKILKQFCVSSLPITNKIINENIT